MPAAGSSLSSASNSLLKNFWNATDKKEKYKEKGGNFNPRGSSRHYQLLTSSDVCMYVKHTETNQSQQWDSKTYTGDTEERDNSKFVLSSLETTSLRCRYQYYDKHTS